jgi:prolyl oligopeptidase
MGTAQSDDRLVYERQDEPEWGFGVEVSDDGAYAVIHVTHGTDERNRVYYQNIASGGEVVQLLDDFDATYEFLETTVHSSISAPTWTPLSIG